MPTIAPSTSISALRDLVQRGQTEVAPVPARTTEIARRHNEARGKGWDVSDIVVSDGYLRTIQESGRTTRISRITTEVFAAAVLDEDALAARYLPASARKIMGENGGAGWTYTVTTDLGDRFELFLYNDRANRQFRVRLLAPRLEQVRAGHDTHLFGDGHLCISASGSGQSMMNNAYAKSVMWCHGISLKLRGHAWPWGE